MLLNTNLQFSQRKKFEAEEKGERMCQANTWNLTARNKGMMKKREEFSKLYPTAATADDEDDDHDDILLKICIHFWHMNTNSHIHIDYYSIFVCVCV